MSDREEIIDLRRANELLHNLIDNRDAEIERLLAVQTVFENVNCTDRAEIERLTADNHKLMLWNEQLQAELDIARRALEGK